MMTVRKAVAILLAGRLLNPGMFLAAAPQSEYSRTTTPIKHLVIIFQENISFDHYFATYPYAMNLHGENPFIAREGTPTVNGLNAALLTHNPNLNTANGTGATNPFRLSPAQASTADQDHNYTPEQQAFDQGRMDLFPKFTGAGGTALGTLGAPAIFNTTGLALGYYDGNTVTAFWNYAQHFAINDNSFGTQFGPSTPGALNVISGQTNGVINNAGGTSAVVADGNGGLTDINDADPAGDVCSTTSKERFNMSGQNIGDLLNAAGVNWGFFNGGFDLTVVNSNGTTGCNRNTTSLVTGVNHADYVPHHQPFQYYASTANPTHARPVSVSAIGTPHDPIAHNQYDIHDFFDAIKAGNFPAVSYLKAPAYQDAHAGYSNPIDEQNFIVNTINFLQQQPEWASTAVIIAYDDSDGWYDHQMSPIVNPSSTVDDALNGQVLSGNTVTAGFCGSSTTPSLPGSNGEPNAQGHCGYGPRLPQVVISPWAKENFVDDTLTDQSSVVRFIEDNWLDGQRITGSFDAIAGSIENMFDFTRPGARFDKLFLNPATGEPMDHFPGLPPHFPFWGW
jgi:phospholipase C